MTTFSPIPAYILGTACASRGVMALLSPREEYHHMGLPLESHAAASPSSTIGNSGSASPLMYFKGIREISYGLMMVALQRQRNEAALTTVAAVLAVVRFGDGLVVWLYGGEKLRYKAWGHWITSVGFLGWITWRWRH